MQEDHNPEESELFMKRCTIGSHTSWSWAFNYWKRTTYTDLSKVISFSWSKCTSEMWYSLNYKIKEKIDLYVQYCLRRWHWPFYAELHYRWTVSLLYYLRSTVMIGGRFATIWYKFV